MLAYRILLYRVIYGEACHIIPELSDNTVKLDELYVNLSVYAKFKSFIMLYISINFQTYSVGQK